MNESCHTHEWVRSHTQISHATRTNEQCHPRHVTYTKKSCDTHDVTTVTCWVMSHVIHMNVWWVMSHVIHKNVSSHSTRHVTSCYVILCHVYDSFLGLFLSHIYVSFLGLFLSDVVTIFLCHVMSCLCLFSRSLSVKCLTSWPFSALVQRTGTIHIPHVPTPILCPAYICNV